MILILRLQSIKKSRCFPVFSVDETFLRLPLPSVSQSVACAPVHCIDSRGCSQRNDHRGGGGGIIVFVCDGERGGATCSPHSFSVFHPKVKNPSSKRWQEILHAAHYWRDDSAAVASSPIIQEIKDIISNAYMYCKPAGISICMDGNSHNTASWLNTEERGQRLFADDGESQAEGGWVA